MIAGRTVSPASSIHPLMAARKATLISPGRIIDPFIEPLFGAQAPSWSPARALRLRLRQWNSNSESKKATKRATRLKGFTLPSFEKQSQQILLQFYKAHLTQDYTSIKELTTDQFFPAVRRGIENAIVRTKSHQSVEVLDVIDPSKVIQGRLVYMTPAHARGLFTEPDYIQLTTRMVTVQAPRFFPIAIGRKQKSVFAELAESGIWKAAISAKGQVYYYHTHTGNVSWERPPSYGVVGTAEVTVDDLGTISEVVSVDEQGLPNKVKVVNYAVFERSVRDNDEWRLCKV